MKILLLILLLTCACFSQSSSNIDWTSTRWGMSEQEIVSAYGAQVRKLPARIKYTGFYVDYVLPAYELDGRNFIVQLQMDETTNKLSAVFIKDEREKSDAADAGYFRRLEWQLTKKYGLPATKDEKSDAVYTSHDYVWRLENGKITKIQLSHFWSPLNRDYILGIRYSPILRLPGNGTSGMLEDEVRVVSVVPVYVKPVAAEEGVKIISKPSPVYTDEAKKSKVGGRVKVRIVFQADGQIGEITVVESSSSALSEMVVEAARKIRFEPAKKNGVSYTTTKTIDYTLTLY